MERSSRTDRERQSPRHDSRRSHRRHSADRHQAKRRKHDAEENNHRTHHSSGRDPTAQRREYWDGVLSPDDDIVFDLTADWEPYRSTTAKMLFGRGGFLTGDRATQDDFWTFFSRLRANFVRQLDREGRAAEESYTVKTPLKKLHIELKNFNIVHRHRLVRGDDECEEIPDSLLKMFHYGVMCYLDFLEKQDFAKLKKLRKSQANLPIANYHQRIVELVRVNPIVIVSGDTGCGKSTQVPQYLLKAGYDKICCTQPRRIACISLSKRVAYETLNEYGSQVAYQIRFEKTKTARTRIVFMTEGLLLRQMGSDATLSQYSVLVLDEVHERHLHSDFLLGVVRGLVEQRPDLRIILMSATINIELFAKYFNQAPVLQVPGRLFPIQIHYSPISAESRSSATARFNPMPYVRILEMIDNKYPVKERGDVLVFLSGINEINTLAEAAGVYAEKTRKWIILSLHSSLSLAEQDKVFDIAPEGVRKCIVSTNIAETSVTIDGIRFVIDSGRVKEMSFDAKYHMQRLQEFWISQASAEQRRGRAGRTGPGVCYRMYQQSDYDAFAFYSTPEIQRVPLDSLILQMVSMGLTEVRQFPFIEPPSTITIEQCIASLKNHGALTSTEELTRVGRTLANLPLDVQVGKILISGTLIFSLLEPILFITAALSIQSPFTNRAFRDLDSKALLEKNFSSHGDSLTLLQVFHAWLEEKVKCGDRSDGSRRWCRKRGVEEQRMYEITKLCAQFREILQEHGLLNSKKLIEEILADRAQRKGEMKQLRFLKRTAQRSKKGRKVLSLDNDTVASDEEKDSGEVDIQDVEFQLQNDRSNIEDMLEASGNLSDQEIRIMKLILTSGFYPNLALADDCNSFKCDQDQIFHTRSKPYVVLHPTSVFAFQPEWLAVPESDIVQTGSAARKGNYSDRHQLLVYASLLETNKPYLMNCMRVPALHSLLLFAFSIDTNLDATRLVFDGWIDIYITNAPDALAILESAIWIRSLWKKLLDLRLLEAQTKSVEVGKKSQGITKSLENDLIAKLSDYVSTPVTYAVKRLLAADMRILYTGAAGAIGLNSGSSYELKENTVKGGYDLLDFLTYNCLVDSMVVPDDAKWVCCNCEESFSATVLDRLTHFISCTGNIKTYEHFGNTGEEEKPKNALDTEYYCETCQKKLALTPVEILRHRRTHVSGTSETL